MHAIQIYRHAGGWAFDDLRHGLVAEALIEGADTLIDRVLQHTAGGLGANKALLRFVDDVQVLRRYWFGHVSPWITLRQTGESNGGTDYEVVDTLVAEGHRVWLCSALLCYYEAAPRALFLDIIPLPDVATEESAVLVSRASVVRPS